MALTSNGFLSCLEPTLLLFSCTAMATRIGRKDHRPLLCSLFLCAVQPFHTNPDRSLQRLISLKKNFEIILVSSDNDEESFQKHFSTMPWLALPHSNQTACDHFKSLVPFTPERIKQLRDEEEMKKKNQSLKSVLATPTRDFVISNDGKVVSISELEGKLVGLYMSLGSFRACRNFTPKLVDFYKSLKEKGESFEIVYVSLEDDKERFENELVKMPWLAIPFGDKSLKKLPVYFKLNALPTLLILGPDGKTLCLNVRDYIAEFGIQAYPFSPEKLTALDELRNALSESQTLESLLVSDELDFVIGKENIKVPVSELVGKTLLFYFSRKICPPCRAFTPKLAKTYHEIKAKHPDFEVIFVSLDNDQESFNKYYSEMPWLTLPYDDRREASLRRTFKSKRIPHLAAVGPNGKILTNEAKELVLFMGSDAYPFDEDTKKEMDRRLEEMAKGWPEKVRNKKHPEHELVLSLQGGFYTCCGCNELMVGWMFSCGECRFELHPECALADIEKLNNVVDDDGDNSEAQGLICDENSRHKA
ncbi:hypothetical protein LWI29_013567 [Acer saccharum]|uniref:protein-disulfide reductase n=1 Tax=Acer saccharum TaxID=4024 RepID=A0AA39RD79_ACESA|nr:hypothetical protein LWI29_013567 [Acer saccharum]